MLKQQLNVYYEKERPTNGSHIDSIPPKEAIMEV